MSISSRTTWMRTLLVITCACMPLVSSAASQQNRMKDCAAQYKAQNIAKSEHAAFMKACLKKDKTGDAPAPVADQSAPTEPAAVSAKGTQQNKMKSCNASAKQKALSGQARKDFMKTCLSGAA